MFYLCCHVWILLIIRPCLLYSVHWVVKWPCLIPKIFANNHHNVCIFYNTHYFRCPTLQNKFFSKTSPFVDFDFWLLTNRLYVIRDLTETDGPTKVKDKYESVCLHYKIGPNVCYLFPFVTLWQFETSDSNLSSYKMKDPYSFSLT